MYMWIVVGGRITSAVTARMRKFVPGTKFQGVNSVLDIINTILTRGRDYFDVVDGFVVLSSGCESIVDKSWMLHLNQLNKPVLYYSTYEEVKESEELSKLQNVTIKSDDSIKIKDLIKDVSIYVKQKGDSNQEEDDCKE